MSPDEKQAPTIAIIGAGLGGLTLAIGLLNQASIPPDSLRLYEAAPCFSEIGAGVASGPNAVRALRLISPRIAEAYAKCVTHNADLSLMSTWLQIRWGMSSKDGSKQAEDLMLNLNYQTSSRVADEELIPGKPVLARSCVHRAAFLDELVKLVPKDICSFSKALEGISDDPDSDCVTLNFTDSSSASANIVVGCDGIRSRTRTSLFGVDVSAPEFAYEYAYRSLVPMESAIKVLGSELAQNGQLYCGYGRYIITYPVEHGDLMNLVAVKRTATPWPLNTAWIAPATRDEMLRDFDGWNEKFLAILNTVETPEKWALFDAAELPSFWKGRVCLMGDAAHSSTPHLGAGSGMAFEDAYVLSNLLGDYCGAFGKGKSLGLHRVFDAFDMARKERAQRLVRMSRTNGIMMHLEDADVRDDEAKLAALLQKRYEWVWQHPLEDVLAEAKEALLSIPL
ncbi:MAG: hypothetical protein M1822_001486 [Bathelium mastoideum]|nr:MAG: hypothetical protein M1822_001486 [Bathelium mastoideum]